MIYTPEAGAHPGGQFGCRDRPGSTVGTQY